MFSRVSLCSHNVECHQDERRYAGCLQGKCLCSTCRRAECRGTVNVPAPSPTRGWRSRWTCSNRRTCLNRWTSLNRRTCFCRVPPSVRTKLKLNFHPSSKDSCLKQVGVNEALLLNKISFACSISEADFALSSPLIRIKLFCFFKEKTLA
jgi:hypothetical protein